MKETAMKETAMKERAALVLSSPVQKTFVMKRTQGKGLVEDHNAGGTGILIGSFLDQSTLLLYTYMCRCMCIFMCVQARGCSEAVQLIFEKESLTSLELSK